MVASLFFLLLPMAMGDNLNSITNCSFDTGMCGWIQDVTDNFDWSRHTGETCSSSTGPSADHTTGKGYYMYIETSKPRILGDKARLVSPTLICQNQTFLMFYYHMYGSNISTLNVYFPHMVSFGKPVWTRNGSQGNKWNKASVQYTSRKGQIVFEGIRGSHFKGDIAVDDISLSGGTCYEASAPPRVHIEPDSDMLRIKEGQNLTVKCVVDNNETPASIVWSHKGIKSSGSTFRIQTVAQSDEGRLTCTARSGERTNLGRADVFIQVVQKPLESLVTGTSTWTLNGTGFVVIGVAAVLVLVFIFVTIHLYRKKGSASVQGDMKSKTVSVMSSNTPCDEEESEAHYEEPYKLSKDSTAETDNRVQTRQERLDLAAVCKPVYDEDDEEDYEVIDSDLTSPVPWKTKYKSPQMFHVSEVLYENY